MNVAKWLLIALLALPLAELAVFVAVAGTIGFVWALTLVLAGSLAGGLILRHAGGGHIARVRFAVDQGSFTALQADGRGSVVLIGGILLLVPGFITDVLGLIIIASALFLKRSPAPRASGVVDLEPEQWRRVPDLQVSNRHEDDREP
jgi:UPF0716 protein FxsA